MTDPSALPAATADRFLAYTADQDLRTTVVATQSATASGMVICSDSPVKSIRLAKSLGYGRPLIADVGAWRRQNATPGSPTLLEAPDSLLQISVDDWADELLTAGASAVLTPSKFIRAGDWDSLRAVLRAADRADLDGSTHAYRHRRRDARPAVSDYFYEDPEHDEVPGIHLRRQESPSWPPRSRGRST